MVPGTGRRLDRFLIVIIIVAHLQRRRLDELVRPLGSSSS